MWNSNAIEFALTNPKSPTGSNSFAFLIGREKIA
jgi:hypothetical protein